MELSSQPWATHPWDAKQGGGDSSYDTGWKAEALWTSEQRDSAHDVRHLQHLLQKLPPQATAATE